MPSALEYDRDDDRPQLAPPTTAEWVVLAVALVAGLVLRFATTSALWLDEALSVNIAALPLGEITDALRQDGHPPLYYGLLHGWMQVFGDGDVAVRALSGVFSVLTLVVVWELARRRGGVAVAAGSMLVLTLLPYATRYATEARMYSLVTLLVAIGWWALDQAFERPDSRWPAVVVGVAAAGLLYSHYWSLWPLGATGCLMLVVWWRSDDERRRVGRRCAVALLAGAVAFVPWLPVLADQLARTGTPWAAGTRPTAALAIAVSDLAGTPVMVDALLGAMALVVLVLLGLFAVPQPPWGVRLDLRTVPGVRLELGVVVAALAVGIAVAWAMDTAFASRYIAFVVPVVAVAAGRGLAVLPGPTPRLVAGVGTAVLLGAVSVVGVVDQRTQAESAAEAVTATSADLVVLCPDQLGPAFSRVADPDLRIITVPELTAPERVDWRDYEERNRGADAVAVAEQILEQREGGSIWIVWKDGYQTYEGLCESVRNHLVAALGGTTVLDADAARYFEPMRVERAG